MESEELMCPQFTDSWSTCSPIPEKRFPITYAGKGPRRMELYPARDRELPEPPIHAGLLGGEINPDKLDAKDTEDLKRFYKMLYGRETPVPYKTRMDKKEVWDFAEKILERLERPI